MSNNNSKPSNSSKGSAFGTKTPAVKAQAEPVTKSGFFIDPTPGASQAQEAVPSLSAPTALGEHPPRAEAEEPSSAAQATTSADFVPTGTKPSDQEREQRAFELLEEARKATVMFDRHESDEKKRRSEYKEVSAIQSRDLIKNMLRVVESFKDDHRELDKEALDKFLQTHVGEKHGGEKAELFRISKYCSTSDTPKVMISKRAYALDIIVERGISPDELDDVFDEDEDNIGPDKVTKSGMQKYILIFQDKHGLLKSSEDKYRDMKGPAFFNLAQKIVSELSRRTKVHDNVLAELLKEIDKEAREAK